VRRAKLVAFAIAAFTMSFGTARAMPNFAQAYGVPCSICHTQVPALNAYGRYIQRTGYAVLDSHVLKSEFPVWIDESVSYSEQTPGTATWQTGNLAIHADGKIASDWTYHIQQWITQGNQPGGLDTAWVAYSNLFARSGHLFIGKVEEPAPSALSQWMDLSPFTSAEMTVGEHQYQLDNNRWGTKFAYVRDSLDAEVAYTTSGADLNGFNDYSNDTDKTWQYRLADANPKQPLEFGYYGSRGSFPLAEGGVDQYTTNALYVQRDPTGRIPGVLAIYQSAYDRNPGMGDGPAASNAGSVELFQNFGPRLMISAAEQFTNDGLGDQTRLGTLDASYHVMRFVHLYGEVVIGQQAKPTWNGLAWFSLPTGPR
jgi:hypothetical protein